MPNAQCLLIPTLLASRRLAIAGPALERALDPEREEGGEAMWRWLKGLTPGKQAWRRMVLAAGFAGVAVLAFCWGRHGGLSQAKATPPGGEPFAEQLPLAPVSNSDYARRVVAYIY